jgi:hypothetical protein
VLFLLYLCIKSSWRGLSSLYITVKNKSQLINIMLDILKVYIDTRFKAVESKSDSDFFVELP